MAGPFYPVIWVVDDDEDDRLVLSEAFTALRDKVQLRFLEDGLQLEEALFAENLRIQDAPRLILMDLNMPRKNGREALKSVRANERSAHIPVVVFSTTNDQDEINHAYALGANAFINKPVSYSALETMIHNLIQFWFRTVSLPVQSQPQNNLGVAS